jgi:hypothetical protein
VYLITFIFNKLFLLLQEKLHLKIIGGISVTCHIQWNRRIREIPSRNLIKDKFVSSQTTFVDGLSQAPTNI